jgi:hypothetical protein
MLKPLALNGNGSLPEQDKAVRISDNLLNTIEKVRLMQPIRNVGTSVVTNIDLLKAIKMTNGKDNK